MPDPRGSDLWVAEESGTGEVELTWTAQPGRWSVLAVGPGESAPRLSLAWPQEVTTPWLVPCVVVGSLLLLAALALLARDLLRSRRRRPDAEWTPVLTGPLPVLDAEGAPVQLTRRQLRELRERGAAVDAGVRAARDESTPAQEATAAPPAGPVAAARPAAGARDADATATTALPAAGAQEGRRRPQGAGDEEPTTGGAAGTRRGLRGLVSRGTADDRPSGASAAPRDEPVRPQRPTGRPDAAGDAGGPAPSGAAPGTGPRGGWSTEPGRPSDAAPGGSRPPASGAPRPAWLQGSSGAPAAGPTGGPAAGAPPAGGPGAPPAGPGTGSRGWVPVPPPPGPVATTRGSSHPDHPTRPAGPAPTSTSRPAWLRDAGQQGTGQQGTGQGAPGQGGVPGAGTPLPPPGPAAAEGPRASGAAGTPDASSRADAWRRAWGLPPLPPEADDRTDREEGR
ncbi:hypothetical protein [Cellulomonas sp.]|uniref:hypothetical protein n=1 Tax=Cellulomonas sp. TaxID=40001 RepID=UPI0028113D0B|nr:hypothetical protein [Cellulomonas sp.]